MRAMVVLSYPYRPINSTVACRMRRRVTSPRALRRLEFIETFLRAKALLDNAAGPPTDIPPASIHRSSNDEKVEPCQILEQSLQLTVPSTTEIVHTDPGRRLTSSTVSSTHNLE